MSATQVADFEETRTDGARWGRLVESAVGAHLLNSTAGSDVEITYWREGGMEVDFVRNLHRDPTHARRHY